MSQASRASYRLRLLAVERALKLFETGDYGYCEDCGECIDPRCLEIKPESVHCLGCQQAREGGP